MGKRHEVASDHNPRPLRPAITIPAIAATMLAAGFPIVQCFDIVGAGHEKPSMQ